MGVLELVSACSAGVHIAWVCLSWGWHAQQVHTSRGCARVGGGMLSRCSHRVGVLELVVACSAGAHIAWVCLSWGWHAQQVRMLPRSALVGAQMAAARLNWC